MQRHRHTRQSREEYERDKAEKEKLAKIEKIRNEVQAKALAKSILKANECPKCQTQMKKFYRKNYPFGKKSKSQITKGKRCPNCEHHIFTQKEVKNRR